METNNQRTVYDFENQSENLKCKGEASYNITFNAINMSAEVMTNDDQILGTFFYMETQEGKINKSIDNVNKIYVNDVEALMLKSVTEFKELLNQQS